VRLPATSEPRPTWWLQVLLVVGFAVGYDEVRSLHGDVVAAGLAHGRQVLALDGRLHICWAGPVNSWLASHHPVAAAMSGYYFVMHLGMTALVLLLLWVRGDGYRRHRNALLVSSLLGLAIYWAYPVAPPRMLPGFHDTVRELLPAAYRLESANANLYAAVPSLHLAWAVWCAVALCAMSTAWWVRAIAVAHPVLTVVTVLGTGNHYTFDLLTGALLVVIAYPVATIAGQSFASGAYRSSSRLVPTSPPKSTSTSDWSATPRTATTRPRPKESWLTRSPGLSARIGRSPGPATRPRRMALSAATCDAEVSVAPVHSTSSDGMSSRNREAGLYDGDPQADRTTARER
jgi:hypothetical protein